VALTEAAIAHAAGELETGRALAAVARSEAARAGLDGIGRLATALAAACGEAVPESVLADLSRWSADSTAPEIAAQVLRLLALSGRATSEVADLYGRRRAEVRPALLGARLDVVDLPTGAGSAFRHGRAHRP
jgi:hypothetical protein